MQVAELFAKLGLQVDKKSWSVGNDVIAGLGKALAVFIGYKVVRGIGDMVGEVIELGGHLNDLAQSSGQNVETLQELGYVAKLNSSSTEALADGLSKLARNMYDADHGSKTVADAFARMGIKTKDASGHLRATEDVLLDMADRFSTMPDGPQKTAEAITVLGRSGATLIPTLNQGRGEIEKLRQEFKDLGGEITGGDISKLDDLGDNLDRMKVAWQGIKNQVVIALAPVLKNMEEGLLKWIKANRELLKSKLQSFVSGLATALKVFAQIVAFVVENWQFFVAALTGIAIVTGILRLIKLMEFLQLASTKAAVKTLIAWAAAAAPFVLIAAAIAGVVLLILKYRKTAREIFNWIVGKLVSIVEWFQSLPSKITSYIDAIGTAIKEKVGAAWDYVKDKAKGAWDYINSLPARVKHGVLDAFGYDDGYRPDGGPATFSAPVMPGQAGYLVPRKGAAAVVTVTNGPMTIQVPPGANPADYEAAVKKGVREEWANQMNHALGDAGEDN